MRNNIGSANRNADRFLIQLSLLSSHFVARVDNLFWNFTCANVAADYNTVDNTAAQTVDLNSSLAIGPFILGDTEYNASAGRLRTMQLLQVYKQMQCAG